MSSITRSKLPFALVVPLTGQVTPITTLEGISKLIFSSLRSWALIFSVSCAVKTEADASNSKGSVSKLPSVSSAFII